MTPSILRAQKDELLSPQTAKDRGCSDPAEGSNDGSRSCGNCRFWEGGINEKRGACSRSWEWPPEITRHAYVCGKWETQDVEAKDASPFDVCRCGDYRHQHDARGCLICRGSRAPYDNCSGFRLSERAAKAQSPAVKQTPAVDALLHDDKTRVRK